MEDRHQTKSEGIGTRTAAAVPRTPRTAGASARYSRRTGMPELAHILMCSSGKVRRTIVASRLASAWAPWRSRRARMLRSRRTLSVYATSAPDGSVFVLSSSTADLARARASATVRLQDRAGVVMRCEWCASDIWMGVCRYKMNLGGVEEGKLGRRWLRVGAGST